MHRDARAIFFSSLTDLMDRLRVYEGKITAMRYTALRPAAVRREFQRVSFFHRERVHEILYDTAFLFLAFRSFAAYTRA